MRRLTLFASCVAVVATALLVVPGCTSKPRPKNPLDPQRAYAHVKAMVDLGPRPPGTTALRKCRDYIKGELVKIGLKPHVDSFEAKNAPGLTFHNVEVEIAGTRPDDERLLVIGSHYDTKRTDVDDSPDKEMVFVGANDGGSSSGLLIELARWLHDHPLPCKVLCVWFDGEESLDWEWGDGSKALFGSKRCVEQLRARFPKDKDLNEVVPVMVLLDMVGCKDLHITRELDSDRELTQIVEAAAAELDYSKYFFEPGNDGQVTDDHVPFKQRGIRVIDIIQFGGGKVGGLEKWSPWWHKADDTLDIVSAESLGIVGHVMTVALTNIAQRFYQ